MSWLDTVKGWFKKPEKKIEKKDFRALKSQAIKEMGKIKSKKQDEKFLGELNKIFRIFIEERYGLKKSLTYEELVKQMPLIKIDGKIKKEITEIASEIHQITYKNQSKKPAKPVKKSKVTNSSSLLSQVRTIIQKS